MNIKTFLASVITLAFTLLQSPAQQPQAPAQTAPAQTAVQPPSPPPPGPAPEQQAQPPAADLIIINVLGEVNRPGRFALLRGSNILDAIATSGGLTRLASPARTILIHRSAGAKPDSVKIDLRPVLSGIARAIPLRDGDTLVIGQGVF